MRFFGLAFILCLLIQPAAAQNWPTRPVTLVVTFAAGSGDDVLARIIAPKLGEALGQTIIVEDVGGAGGMIGTDRVARADPDGYQIVMGGTGTFAANQTLYKHPSYDASKDFEPVGLIAEQPLILAVRNSLPVNSLKEFISYAKTNTGKLQFASGGVGSATHLGCLLLNAAIGIEAIHVPYRSTTIALQDIIADRVDYACPIEATVIGAIQSKQIKPIAILTKKRSPLFPDLATASEQGLTGFEAYIWDGLFLPKHTPAAIIEKLHAALMTTLNDRDVQAHIEQVGGEVVEPERRSPAYLADFVNSEIQKWAKPIRDSGLQIE
jgi:tripartite-type tricarboxylate transporter receptor subunit TctC